MKITTDWPQSFEFACHSKACAPPPTGRGGSDKGGSGHASHQYDPAAMTENERLAKRRYQAGHAFETMKMPDQRGADRRKAPRYVNTERRLTSQQRHANLIQQIRRDLEAVHAKNRALRAVAKIVAANHK